MSSELARAVETEIAAMHEAIVAWFTGVAAMDDFDTRIAARLGEDFHYVLPAGVTRRRDDVVAMLLDGFGSNPSFAITIANVAVRAHAGDLVVAHYEERQTAANHTLPADNVRLSTVVLRRHGGQFEWLHLHETTAGS